MSGELNVSEFELLKDNTDNALKNIVGEKQKKDLTKFTEAIKKNSTNKPEEMKHIVDAFNKYGDDVLNGIKDNLINNFNSANATLYQTAIDAFKTDIATLKAAKLPEIQKKEKTMNNNYADDIYASSQSETQSETPSQDFDTLNAIIADIQNLLDIKKILGEQSTQKTTERALTERALSDINADITKTIGLQTFRGKLSLKDKKKILIGDDEVTTSLIDKLKELSDEKTAKEQENKRQAVLNIEKTGYNATRVFEQEEDSFNAMFDAEYNTKNKNKQIKDRSPVDVKDNTKVVNLLKKYWETEYVSDIKFGKAGDEVGNNGKKFADKFEDGTRVIEMFKGQELTEQYTTKNGITFKKEIRTPQELTDGTTITVGGVEFSRTGETITAKYNSITYTYNSKSEKFENNNNNNNQELNLSKIATFSYDEQKQKYIVQENPKITATKNGEVYTYNETDNKFINDTKNDTEQKVLDLGDRVKFEKKDGKYIIYEKVQTVRGTSDHLQKLKTKKGLEEVKNMNDMDDRKEGTINKFDDKGNYRTFEAFLEYKKSDYVLRNLEQILTQIKNYEPKKETDDYATYSEKNFTELKNGYATALTKYVTSADANDELLKKYCEYLKPENISYLGVDKATQIQNFNMLVTSAKFKALNLDATTRQNILDLRFAIEKVDQKPFKEKMKSGFKEILKSFGGLIMDIIEFFGGKGALRKFCAKFGIDYDKYFEDLEKLYDDTYALNDAQKKLLKDIPKENRSTNENNDLYYYNLEGKKTKITYSKKHITSTYTEIFYKRDNFKNMDARLVESAMKNLNIGNQDVIITKKVNGGIINKEINENHTLTDSQIKKIVNYIIFGDGATSSGEGNKEIRKQIQEANNSITHTDSIYNENITKDMKNITQKMRDEEEQAKEGKYVKGYRDAIGIGIFFGAYLMKGSKDLKYTISQTDDLPHEEKQKKDYDKIIKKSTEAPEVSDEDEITAKLTELKKNLTSIQNDKYGTGTPVDIYNFTYNNTINASQNQKDYQDKILNQLENFFTGKTNKNNKSYYENLVTRLNNNDQDAQSLFNPPIHIANIFIKNGLKNEKKIQEIITLFQNKDNNTFTVSAKNSKIQIIVTKNDKTKKTVTLEPNLSKSTVA